MDIIGKVLWWSDRDENGIIVDESGNEFYFDSPVLNLRPAQKMKSRLMVTFDRNHDIKHCPCACDVQIFESAKKVEDGADRAFDSEASASV